MIQVKFETPLENLEQVLETLKQTGFAHNIFVEEDEDKNLKPITAVDFYKKINASNLAEREKKVISQKALREEVKSW